MYEELTIIVPIYKIKEEYLKQCIESIIKQTSKKFKLILIDDGSPDNCGEICDEYSNRYKFIETIHQKNSGVSDARNKGILQTKTKWLTFIDPDDWIEYDMVEEVLEKLNNDAKDTDILMYNYNRVYEKKINNETLWCEKGFLDDKTLKECKKAPFYKLIQNNKINPFSINAIWNKIYRTSFLKKNNILFISEARKGQDRLFNADAFNSTNKIFYLDKLFYHYRCYSESVTNRYNDKILELTNIEIVELGKQMKKHNLNYEEFFDARICTRLYSCIRLYFFNKKNTSVWKEKKSKLNETINKPPFCEALKNINLNLLSFKEKMFIVLLKKKHYILCWVAIRIIEKLK